MRSASIKIFTALLTLSLVWGVSTWFIANSTQKNFASVLEVIASSKASALFELEVIKHDEGFFGSASEIKMIPVSSVLDESIELQRLMIHIKNGPVFLSREGVQFGLARWEFSLRESVPDVTTELSSTPRELIESNLPFGTAVIGFSEVVYLALSAAKHGIGNWAFDEIAVAGVLDLVNANYDFNTRFSGLTYRQQEFLLSINDLTVESKSARSRESASTRDMLTQLVLKVNQSELSLRGNEKKLMFNLESNGSIWANNDTLSGDILLNSTNDTPLAAKSVYGSLGESDVVMGAKLQFRELLADGFWRLLNAQSEIFSLLQQADWAMEDIETPEQQDFLRSLYLDVTRVTQSKLHNSLQPLLIADQSEVVFNASFSDRISEATSQFLLGGMAGGKAVSPELALKGEIKVDSKMLSKQTLALLDKWSNRQWFRHSETEFEADVAVRNKKLLLNNFLVSVDGLKAELSQALADQQINLNN